jgi:hypothetical protein
MNEANPKIKKICLERREGFCLRETKLKVTVDALALEWIERSIMYGKNKKRAFFFAGADDLYFRWINLCGEGGCLRYGNEWSDGSD